MKGELKKRPNSKGIAMMRPITGQVNQANRNQSEQCFQMGKKHMSNKEYPQALRHYFNATVHDPYNYKAFCNMGTILRELGNYKEAKKTYQRALMGKPDDYVTLYNFANLNRISGDEDAAVPLYQKVILLKENQKVDIGSIYTNSLLNMGICYQNIGNFDRAIQTYNKFIEAAPNEQSGYFNKGMCILKKIQKISRQKYNKVQLLLCDEATDILKKSIEKNKDNLTTKIALIQLNYIKKPQKQQYEVAITDYKKLLEEQVNAKIKRQDDKQFINSKIGFCYAKLKNFEQSVKYHQGNAETTKSIASKKSIVSKDENTYDEIKQNADKAQKNKKTKEQQQSSKINNTSRPNSRLGSRPGSRVISRKSTQQNNKQQEQKPQDLIQKLLNEQKFQQALDEVDKMPDGKEKYIKQMYINFVNAQFTGEEIYLNTAKQIYDNKILQNGQTVTKQTCSHDGHKISAQILVELQEYQQATKHYQVLMQMLQDEKSSVSPSDSVKNNEQQQKIRLTLGNLYVQQKMFAEAIKQLRKNYQKNPKDYQTLASLCSCYLQDNQQSTALKLYQLYLQQNYSGYKQQNLQLQDKQQKYIYISCLIDMAICLRDKQQQQLTALRTLKRQMQRLCPTYNQRKQIFPDTGSTMGIYLRLIQILQIKVEPVPFAESKELNQELLDCYLGCLQFPQCPDRDEILTNCGIIFYLLGCYSNAYISYCRVQDRYKHNNDIALTLAHLEDYEPALLRLQAAVEQSPQNIIYRTNFQILKWICGLLEECSKNKLVTVMPCKCENMVYQKSIFGLGLIDLLTQILNSNPEKIQNNNNKTVQEQSNDLIQYLYDQCSRGVSNKKMAFAYKYLQEHIKNFDAHDFTKQIKLPQMSHDFISRRSLNLHSNPRPVAIFLKNIKQYLQKTPPNPYYVTIIQFFFSLPFAKSYRNRAFAHCFREGLIWAHPSSHALQKKPIKIDRQQQFIDKHGSIFSYQAIYQLQKVLQKQEQVYQEFTTKQQKNQKIQRLKYAVTVKYPYAQLNIQHLLRWLRDVESIVETDCQALMQQIQICYYESQGIVQPLRKQIKYGHCNDISKCESCYIKAMRNVTTLFKQNQIQAFLRIHQKQSYDECKLFEQMEQNFTKFAQTLCHRLYNKQDQKAEFQIDGFSVPFIISTHHRKFEDVQKFLVSIDQSFVIKLHEGDLQGKGVRNILINKLLVLQVWWGQIQYDMQQKIQNADNTITYLDKYCNWWQTVTTSFTHQGFIMLTQQYNLPKPPAEQKGQMENQKYKIFPQGIKATMHLYEQKQKMLEKIRVEVLGRKPKEYIRPV